MNKEHMYENIRAELFFVPKETYRKQIQKILLENIRIQKITSVVTYTLYKGEKYTTTRYNLNTQASNTATNTVHVDTSLYPQLDLVLRLLRDLIITEVTLNSYIARALNLATVSKDVALLLPWANLRIHTYSKICPTQVKFFLEENKEYAHMAKERMLMNLLMK